MAQSSQKIKVCQLTTGDVWGGAESHLVVLLQALVKMTEFEISAVIFNEGRLFNELTDLGIRTHVIPESRHKPLSIIKHLRDYFGQYKCDILHTHKAKDNVLGVVSSVCRNVSYRVRTIHGLPEPHVGYKALKASLHQILDSGVNRWLVDRILAVSLDIKNQLAKRVGAEKITCIHNAINVDNSQADGCTIHRKKELGLSGEEFLIATMGRLTAVKGMEFFLKAARIIRCERPNAKFIIAGDGPLRGSLETRAREYGIDEDVIFLGHRNDSHAILGLVDVLVLPSLSEGIPMVLLEALAQAIPVVASRVGGIPEVVEHRVSGILVTPGREDELAQSCIGLMDDYDWARKLGIAGRKRIEQDFSATIMADKVAKVYRSLAFGTRCG